MSPIKEKLDLLEARLADLIEGKLSRWFQSKDLDRDISSLVVREMYAGSSGDQSDDPIVPDAFTILANPEDPRWWEDEPALCDQLSAIILQAGRTQVSAFHLDHGYNSSPIENCLRESSEFRLPSVNDPRMKQQP